MTIERFYTDIFTTIEPHLPSYALAMFLGTCQKLNDSGDRIWELRVCREFPAFYSTAQKWQQDREQVEAPRLTWHRIQKVFNRIEFSLQKTLYDHDEQNWMHSLQKLLNDPIVKADVEPIRTWKLKDPILQRSTIQLLKFPNGQLVLNGPEGKVCVLGLDNKIPSYLGDEVYFLPMSKGRIATGSNLGQISVWNSEGTKEMCMQQKGSVSSLLEFSEYIVSASVTGEVIIWDSKGTPTHLNGHTHAVDVLLKLSEKEFASGSQDGTIRIWNLNGTLERVLKGHSKGVTCLKQLPEPDGRLISASADGTVRIWNSNGSAIVLEGHTDEVSCLLLLSHRHIVSGSRDKTIRIWPLDGTAQVLKGHDGAVSSLSLLPDGRFVSSSLDGTLKIWNPNIRSALIGEERIVRTFCHIYPYVEKQLQCSSKVANRENEQQLQAFTWRQIRQILQKIDFELDPLPYSVNSEVSCFLHLHNGSLVYGCRNGWIGIPKQNEIEFLPLHSDEITCLQQYNNESIISTSRDKTLKIFNLKNKEVITSQSLFIDEVTCLLQLPDHCYLLGFRNGKMGIYKNQNELSYFQLHSKEVTYLLNLQNDHEHIISGSRNGQVKLFNITTLVYINIFDHTKELTCLRQLRNGDIVACFQDGLIGIWNCLSKKEKLIERTNEITSILELFDGRIACASKGIVMIFNPELDIKEQEFMIPDNAGKVIYLKENVLYGYLIAGLSNGTIIRLKQNLESAISALVNTKANTHKRTLPSEERQPKKSKNNYFF